MAQVILPFDGDFDALRRKLAAWGFEVGERPNTPVFARGHGITLSAYNTGKVLVQGSRAEEWAAQLRAEIAPPARAASRKAPRTPGLDDQGRDLGSSGPRVPQSSRGARSGSPPPEWVMHFDGCCEPMNPGGVAAWGYHVERNGARVQEDAGLAAAPGPRATNNVAEFHGLLWGLRWLDARGVRAPLVLGDSKLIVEITNGARRVNAPHLAPLAEEARHLAERLGARVEWVPREQNAEADRLSRVGYERAVRKHPEWGFPSKYRV